MDPQEMVDFTQQNGPFLGTCPFFFFWGGGLDDFSRNMSVFFH